MNTRIVPRFGGVLEVVPQGIPRPPDAVVSHTDDGRTVVWRGVPAAIGRRAVDVERPRSPVPRAARQAASLTGHTCPWTAWTLLETEAKLANVPVVRLLNGAESRPKGKLLFEPLWLGDLRCMLGIEFLGAVALGARDDADRARA